MPPELPIRQRIRQEFRAAIMEAALDVFSERGFPDAQMREIAGRAGVAVGTLYNLFKSKEDLYSALLREHAFELGAAISEWLSQDRPPLQILVDYLDLKARLLRENRKLLKLYIAGAGFAFGAFTSGLPQDIRKAQLRLLEAGAEVFRSAMDQGHINPRLNCFELAVGFENFMNGFVQLDLEFPDQHPFEAKIPGIIETFFLPVVTDEAHDIVLRKLNRIESQEGIDHDAHHDPLR